MTNCVFALQLNRKPNEAFAVLRC